MRIAMVLLISIAACARAPQPQAPTPSYTQPTARLPVRTGNVHDFDFLAGAWNVRNRTLKPGGGDQWVEWASTTCMTLHLGGVVNVDEYQFPTRGFTAMGIRIFNLEKRQWAIYWIESRVGMLLPPVFGGFDGDRGEFYGADEMNGKPVIFRFIWNKLGADRARWEQAYSPDGKDWTTNWEMEFTRAAGPACRGRRTRRGARRRARRDTRGTMRTSFA
jgi:hypothetical protein